MKLAFVVHRYGSDIAGGSEAECREYAERLAPRHDVTVLTTSARDYITWANALPVGSSRSNGVTVVRFPVARPRSLKRFADLSEAVFAEAAAPDLEVEWFRENGPEVPALLDHLLAHGAEYDLVVFFTYRYAPSFFGLPLVADRAVLVPTAEEDPAIRLGVVSDFFTKPAGFLFNTPEEQALVSRAVGGALGPAAISGFGVDAVETMPGRRELDRLGLPSDFVLYLGRVDRNKGADALARVFLEHLEMGGADTMLVFAGPATTELPRHERLRPLGFVSNAVRDELLTHARALMVPSPYESLSIVLLEAWNRGVPALVNGRCAVLRGQVARADGGLYYESALEFSEALSYLLTRSREARLLGQQGLHYVDREYRWPAVMARVERLLEAVVASRASKRAPVESSV